MVFYKYLRFENGHTELPSFWNNPLGIGIIFTTMFYFFNIIVFSINWLPSIIVNKYIPGIVADRSILF